MDSFSPWLRKKTTEQTEKQPDKRTGRGLRLRVYREAANLSLPQALAKGSIG